MAGEIAEAERQRAIAEAAEIEDDGIIERPKALNMNRNMNEYFAAKEEGNLFDFNELVISEDVMAELQIILAHIKYPGQSSMKGFRSYLMDGPSGTGKSAVMGAFKLAAGSYADVVFLTPKDFMEQDPSRADYGQLTPKSVTEQFAKMKTDADLLAEGSAGKSRRAALSGMPREVTDQSRRKVYVIEEGEQLFFTKNRKQGATNETIAITTAATNGVSHLAQADNAMLFTLTNYTRDLEPAYVANGKRMTKRIHVDLPTAGERLELVALYLEAVANQYGEEFIEPRLLAAMQACRGISEQITQYEMQNPGATSDSHPELRELRAQLTRMGQRLDRQLSQAIGQSQGLSSGQIMIAIHNLADEIQGYHIWGQNKPGASFSPEPMTAKDVKDALTGVRANMENMGVVPHDKQ